MKTMKAMLAVEHFDRSGMADWIAGRFSSKLDEMRSRDAYRMASPLCQAVGHVLCHLVVTGILGSIGAFNTTPSEVVITTVVLVSVWSVALGAWPSLSYAKGQLQSENARPCHDLRGGGTADTDLQHEVGSKAWMDAVLSGLRARHLDPPPAQLRMLVADSHVKERLTGSKSTRQQLDILCGAAFKAKLGWQKKEVPASTPSKPSPPQPPPVQVWRLRSRDWHTCQPASTSTQAISGDRSDAFRAAAEGDPLSAMWSRKPGAYFVSAAEATRVIKTLPSQVQPAGLFTLLTTEPTTRSEATPVQILVLYPDGSPHLVSVYLTHFGTAKLVKVDWNQVSLAPVATVEILLEWWKDLSTEEVLSAYKLIETTLAKSTRASSKGKASGKGKAPNPFSRLPDCLISPINTQISRMLGDSSGQRLNAWKTTGHSVKHDIIRVAVRVPKELAVTWLKEGTSHPALIARDVSDFHEASDLRKVWVAHGSVLLEGDPRQIQQALILCLADFGNSWSLVRTPFRWGIRVPKDREAEAKALLQPHAVHVKEGHVRYRIENVPQSLDPEVLVATLASAEGGFKPYLVSSGKSTVVIAAPTAPQDIVFCIKDINATLVLQHLPDVTRHTAVVGVRRSEGASPKRKARRPESPAPPSEAQLAAAAPDVRGGRPPKVQRGNKFQPLSEDFPPLTGEKGEPPGLPNTGNTCYAAVALQTLLQIASCSVGFDMRQLAPTPLRSFLLSPGHGTWLAFLKAAGLGGSTATPEDAALYLEGLIEPEQALVDQVRILERTCVECAGCGEKRAISAASHVHRLAAPNAPCELQTLLREEELRLEPEIEVQCPQCFAETAIPISKGYTSSSWMLVQLRRGGSDSAKSNTEVHVFSESCVQALGKRWEPSVIVCHRGRTSEDGHYTALRRDADTDLGWRLFDDATVRAATPADLALVESCGTVFLFRECVDVTGSPTQTVASAWPEVSDCPEAPACRDGHQVNKLQQESSHPEVSNTSLEVSDGRGWPSPCEVLSETGTLRRIQSEPALGHNYRVPPVTSHEASVSCAWCPGVALTRQLADHLVEVSQRLVSLEKQLAQLLSTVPDSNQNMFQPRPMCCSRCSVALPVPVLPGFPTPPAGPSERGIGNSPVILMPPGLCPETGAPTYPLDPSDGGAGSGSKMAISPTCLNPLFEAFKRGVENRPEQSSSLPSAQGVHMQKPGNGSNMAISPTCHNPLSEAFKRGVENRPEGSSSLPSAQGVYMQEPVQPRAPPVPKKYEPAPALQFGQGPQQDGSFPRSPLPAVNEEVQGLQQLGHCTLAWIFERLHADALLRPLATVAGSDAAWQALQKALQLKRAQAQQAVVDGTLEGDSTTWIITRILSRGRFARFAEVAAQEWHIFRSSLGKAFPPDGWTPPLRRASSARLTRPLLPNEWARKDRAAARCDVPLPAPLEGDRLQQSQPALKVLLPPTPDGDCSQPPAPPHTAHRKRRRKTRVQADLLGGSSGPFQAIALNVTSLFSRIALLCTLCFSVALISETSLTAKGQQLLTQRLHNAGRSVVWGADTPGKGVSSSRGVGIIGGPGLQLAHVAVPDTLQAEWRQGRVVAGRAMLRQCGVAREVRGTDAPGQGHTDGVGAQGLADQVQVPSGEFTVPVRGGLRDASAAQIMLVCCYGDVYDASARESCLEKLAAWVTSVSGHVILGGDFNTHVRDSPSLMALLGQGWGNANQRDEVTCVRRASNGSVIEHVLYSPSLRRHFQEGWVMQEAPFPTHKPVGASFDVQSCRQDWQVLQKPKPFPIRRRCSQETCDAQVWGTALQAIEHLLEEGQCKAAYETWCSAAEATLAEGCRDEGELVSCRHFGRSKVPQLRTCAALQRAGGNVEGDATVRRLEKARSGAG